MRYISFIMSLDADCHINPQLGDSSIQINRVDTAQTAHWAVWSVSTLFAILTHAGWYFEL